MASNKCLMRKSSDLMDEWGIDVLLLELFNYGFCFLIIILTNCYSVVDSEHSLAWIFLICRRAIRLLTACSFVFKKFQTSRATHRAQELFIEACGALYNDILDAADLDQACSLLHATLFLYHIFCSVDLLVSAEVV